jgi:hypothetical protein
MKPGRTFWNEKSLARANRGKPSAVERARRKLRAAVAPYSEKWRRESQEDQENFSGAVPESDKRVNENRDMTALQKARLRTLVHRELASKFQDYSHFEEALARVLKKHPDLAGGRAELANEFNNVPTPAVFRQEVAAAQQANGGDYDLAFAATMEKYSGLGLRQPDLSNEDLSEAVARTEQVQKLVREYCATYGLDPNRSADYTRAYARVLELNPTIADAMHKPSRSNSNLWRSTPRDGTTPPSKSGRGQGNPAAALTSVQAALYSPPDRAKALAK